MNKMQTEKRLQIRIKIPDYALIEEAAGRLGQTVSSFVRATVLSRAHSILKEDLS